MTMRLLQSTFMIINIYDKVKERKKGRNSILCSHVEEAIEPLNDRKLRYRAKISLFERVSAS